ncbi:hypothetical protein Y032_0017g3303 [Ancylostoma ceylanicum]|uniref:Uncharacterized protein n=1 Tax=Ancylostoma ceylanicum TaxID=53326 RepID=A0A016V519_9BILA|nr:hypothetical protein Y032_0017g3303 [Ancylostoma ceylanicum]
MEELLRRRNVKNLVDLRRESIKIWTNLDVNYLRRTIDSMKKQIDACIKADGGHFTSTHNKSDSPGASRLRMGSGDFSTVLA